MEAMKKEIFSPLKKVSNNKYLQQANSSNEHFFGRFIQLPIWIWNGIWVESKGIIRILANIYHKEFLRKSLAAKSRYFLKKAHSYDPLQSLHLLACF